MSSSNSSCDWKVENRNDTTFVSSKKPRTSAVDFISELPNEIICSIIMHLTVKEAIRTSILSHRWEKLWYSLPTFQLDWDNMFEGPPLCDRRKTSGCLFDNADSKTKLTRMANLFLEFCDCQQDGEKLHLCFCFGQEYFQAVELWVNLALRKKDVHDLSLRSFCDNCCKRVGTFNCHFSPSRYQHQYQRKVVLKANYNEDYPVLPNDNRFQDTSDLKRLQLTGFTLGPTFFTNNNLRCLLNLRLSCVQLLPSFGMVLHYMPNLEFFFLSYCDLADRVLDLGPLCSLFWFLLWRCPGVEKVLVSSDNNKKLERFQCNSSQSISCDLSGLRGVSHLECCVDGRELQYMFENVRTKFPKLLGLGITTSVNWVQMIPNNLTTFCTVRLLTLWFSNCFEFSILKIISILKSFPFLTSLELRTDDLGETQPAECLQRIDYFPRRLWCVVIGGYLGPVHIQLAAFLLQRAAATIRCLYLEKAILNSRLVFSPLPWVEEERQKVTGSSRDNGLFAKMQGEGLRPYAVPLPLPHTSRGVLGAPRSLFYCKACIITLEKCYLD